MSTSTFVPVESLEIGGFKLHAPRNRLELVRSLFGRYKTALSIYMDREEMVNISWRSFAELRKRDPLVMALLEALDIVSPQKEGNFEIFLAIPGGPRRPLELYLVDEQPAYFTQEVYASLYTLYEHLDEGRGFTEIVRHPVPPSETESE